MKHALASVPNRPISSATLALGLSFGLALAACRIAAADATNAAVPAARTPPPTKLVIPPEWKLAVEARDYNFDNLPLTEVTRNLQDEAKQQIDVLMPGSVVLHWPPPGQPAETTETAGIPIKLRLKNASVIEVFQAMNMLFEIESTPLRWELAMNGQRPVALLRQLEAEPTARVPGGGTPAEVRPKPVTYSVVAVEALFGAPDAGGMKPDALSTILLETAQETLGASSTRKIQFHPGSGLLILSGTEEELRFMQDVLKALRDKFMLEQSRSATGARELPAKK
jgi:hypothetical protein